MLNPSDFIKESIEEIKKQIGDEKAIIALSGGVDSSVASVLVSQAIGDNLMAVFVDHGLLREGEAEYVKETFEPRLNFDCIDASDEFLKELEGVEDPEEKRKIIGEVFIRVFEREAEKEGAKFLVQGTIAPDWIESEGKIKSHHNVALPHGLVLELVEPIRELYKDEVRVIGSELGLPDEIVNRQPFPGPGLAVRVVGKLTPEKIEICRKANAIVEEEVKKEGLDETLWQYFAVLTDTKVTGVKIMPRNIFILDEDSQNMTINNLRNFYNSLDYEFWIIVADRPVDISLYLSQLQLLYNNVQNSQIRKLITQDVNKANDFANNNIVDTEYYLIFQEKNPEVISKRLRSIINDLAACGLNAAQTTNDDLRVIIDNFLNGGRTTEFGTVMPL
jgi:GMP synthase (glutamine-hydrolysing)